MHPLLKLERPIVSLDIESTGLDVALDRIIDLAVVKIFPTGDVVPVEFRFNPGVTISKEATDIHGITNEMVEFCPLFKDQAATIITLIAGCDFLGYNLRRFDVPMLHEEFARVGVNLDMDGIRIIDASSIFQKKEPRNLTAAVMKYCGKSHEGAHGAKADAVATHEVLLGQFKAYPDLAEMSLDDLAAFCKQGDNIDLAGKFVRNTDGKAVYNFGNKKGTAVADDPGLANWMLSKDFTTDTKNHARRILDEVYAQQPKESLF